MSNNLFVDTAGWGYYLDRLSLLHQPIQELVRQAASQRRQLVTTNYIVAELVALLSSRYHQPRRQVLTAIRALKSDPMVEVIYADEELGEAALTLLEARQDKEWSLVDATSFVIMQRRGMFEAITTDHHFAQAGFIMLPLST